MTCGFTGFVGLLSNNLRSSLAYRTWDYYCPISTSKAKSKVKANAFPKLRASFDYYYFDVAKFILTFESIWGSACAVSSKAIQESKKQQRPFF